ncbi:MAG: hypothetical protein AB7W16_28020 [Candidatus Obscuribacterales bacterium]
MTRFEFNQESPAGGDSAGRSALSAEAGQLLSVRPPGETHRVRPGESLSSLAKERLSRASADKVSDRAILMEVERIIEANADRYPSLIHRPGHLLPGWELRLDENPEERPARPRSKEKQPEMNRDGDHLVGTGETLSGIAVRELKRRGLPSVCRDDLDREMSRIVANNLDRYPGLADRPDRLQAGWSLRIWDYSLGPEPFIDWKPWKVAEPGAVTVVKKGERVEAGSGAWIIVEPGGRAITNSGSKAFLYHNARIDRALPGSMIVAAGGEVVDYGATIQAVRGQVKILPGF